MQLTAEAIAQSLAVIGLFSSLDIFTYLYNSLLVNLVNILTLATPLRGWQSDEIPGMNSAGGS